MVRVEFHEVGVEEEIKRQGDIIMEWAKEEGADYAAGKVLAKACGKAMEGRGWRRLTKPPKVHLADFGLACHLLGVS